MEKDYFEKLQKSVAANKITIKAAVEKLAIIIRENYAMFEMEELDEDFKGAVLVEFLQNGHNIFERFDKSFGRFFTYLYANIKGFVLEEKRKRARQVIIDKVNIVQSLESYFEMQEKNDFTLVVEDSMCVPYAHNGFKKEELQRTVKEFMAKRQYKKISKAVIILALKASYDITDEEINTICTEFKIDKDDFYRVVMNLKSNLKRKSEARNKIITRRNKAYYYHMKYSDDFANRKQMSDKLKKEYDIKFKKNTRQWEETNIRLQSGAYHLSPTNDAIAEALGISTRQVCYYIHTFKEELNVIKNKYKLDTLYSVVDIADENDTEEN